MAEPTGRIARRSERWKGRGAKSQSLSRRAEGTHDEAVEGGASRRPTPARRTGALSARRRRDDGERSTRSGGARCAPSHSPGHRATHVAPHVLLALGDAWGSARGDSEAGRASRPRDDATRHASEPGGCRPCDSAAGSTDRERWFLRETGNGGSRDQERERIEAVRW